MNRKSLFGRLSASTIVSRPAERQSYFRLQLEPLEERKLLTVATTYVNDNWFDSTTSDGIVRPGDLLVNTNDTIAPGSVTATYTTSGFGLVTKWSGGAVNQSTGYLNSNFKTIFSAIQGTNLLNGTLNLLEGTYKESDIVIDRPLNFIGAGKTGAARSLIIPEDTAVSTLDASAEFPVGTRQGILIYSPDVTVSNVAVDGNGNATTTANAGHTLNFHQGITTLYDTQAGGPYASLHNGNLTPIQLGAQFSANRSRANIAVVDVAVSNVYYHGITLSALGGQQWGISNGSGANVDRAIVTNVGDTDLANPTPPANQDENRVGILIQNVDNDPFGAPNDGNIRFSSVSNAGTGIKTGVFGTKSYASQANARNLTGLILNTVTDAVKRGYWIDFGDGGEGKRGNVATWTNPSNNAEGVYLNHSRALLEGFIINNAKVGIHVQNNPIGGGNQIILGIGGNFLTGPGTGVAGSIGLLIDNKVGESDSSIVMLGAGTTISGYQTGVKAGWVTPDVVANDGFGLVANNIQLTLANPTFGVNGTGMSIGDGVIVTGNVPGVPTLTTTGAAVISPTYPNWANYYYLVPGNTEPENSAPFLAPPTADVLNVGNVLLNSSTTFAPLLTNQSGTTPLFNFNAALNFPFALVPDVSADQKVPSPNGVLFNWYGNLTQDGSGTIVLGGTATNGKGLDFAFAGNNSGAIPNTTPTLYQLIGTDISNRTTLNIVAKKLATSQSETLGIGLFDVRGNANLWTFKFSDLSSVSYTTIKVNLLAPTINLTGPDDHLDLTKISGWVFGGDQGAVNGNQNIPYGLVVDDMYADSIASSQLNATGTVNLGLASLNLSASASFVPTAGQQFVIVDNDGADAVTSSFAGFAQGASTVIGGHTFTISYTGGTNNNDVVLTEQSPILDLNGSSAAGTSFTNTWSKLTALPVFVTDFDDATAADGGGTLVSMSAQITNWHTGDILSAAPVGGITASWNAGANTLVLSGANTVANYQASLRSIKYTNSAGGPGVSPVNITVTASDGTFTSAPVFATITDPPPLFDLNGTFDNATFPTGSTAAFTVGAGAVALTQADATVSDLDDNSLVSMTVSIISSTVHNPNPNDPPINVAFSPTNSLTFTPTGSITGSYNAGTGVLNLTGVDSIANYQTVLRSIKYNNSADPVADFITVSFVASDGVVTGPAQNSVITVNLPLVVDLAGTAGLDNLTTWINNGPINIADITSATVVDTVDGSPDSITLQITNPNAGDILSATDSGGVTSNWDAINNRMTLTGNVSAAAYQTVLRTVKYDNTQGGPGVFVNVGTVVINVIGVSGAVTSRTAVARVNASPVVDLNGTGGLQNTGFNYNATWSNAGAIAVVDSDATVISPGRPNLLYMTVKITQNGTNGITEFHTGDVLSATVSGGISQTYTNGVLTLAGPASAAAFQTVLRTVTYNNTNGGPGAGAQIFIEFLADDDDNESGKSVIRTSTVNVNVPLIVDLNGNPTGTGFINNITPWTTAGSPQAPVSTTVARVASDTIGTDYTTATGRNITSMIATIGTDIAKSGGVHQGDILTATTLVGGITQSYNQITGVLTLSGNTTSANYTTVLRSIRYDNNNPFGGPGADFVYVWIVGVDSTNIHSNAALGQLDINSKENVDLNGPGGGPNDYATTWTNTGPVNISDSDATVKDGDRAFLTSMTVTIGNPSAGDALSAVVTGTNIDVQGIGSTQLTFNAKPPLNTDELANWQTVLRTVQYFNTVGGPGAGPVFIQFDYTDGFGAAGTTAETTVNIAAATQSPDVDLNGPTGGTGFASTWIGAGAISITDAAAATVTDADSANLASMTATIATGANINNVLSANTAGTPISQTYNAGTGVLTLSGSATKAQYQQVLRTVKYNNTGAGPGVGTVTVDFVANDGVNSSGPGVTSSITINPPAGSSVVARKLFYNQSGTATRYDGNNLAINASDDNAIATDKTAYLWEDAGAATFANVSSYTKGINGIMIDLAGTHGSITAADFIFRVGNNNSPGTWATANAPTSISVRAGAGTAGSDRVEIIWKQTAPIKQWLEVIMKANANTGLPQKAGHPAGHGDAFFFGNAVGNSGLGDTAINATVNATDENGARNNPANLAANIPITNIYDYDRNAQVNANDQNAARNNGTNPTTVVKYINLTTAPAAPEADGGGEISPLVAGDSGVASALTAPATTGGDFKVPTWIANRLESIDLNSGVPARVFQRLHDANTPGSRALLQKIDAVADSLGLDDTLLDELLADLGL